MAAQFHCGNYINGRWFCDCELEAAQFTAHTDRNFGRKFLRCPQPRQEQCRFFIWESDEPQERAYFIERNRLREVSVVSPLLAIPSSPETIQIKIEESHLPHYQQQHRPRFPFESRETSASSRTAVEDSPPPPPRPLPPSRPPPLSRMRSEEKIANASGVRHKVEARQKIEVRQKAEARLKAEKRLSTTSEMKVPESVLQKFSAYEDRLQDLQREVRELSIKLCKLQVSVSAAEEKKAMRRRGCFGFITIFKR